MRGGELGGDILGGEYLKADEEINEGTRLLIDVFDVTVHSRVQEEPETLDHIYLIDLTEDPKPSKPRFSGRFWVLADEDDEVTLVDDDDAGDSPEYSPTPSSIICEAFDQGYSEDEVAAIGDGVVPLDDPARVGLHPDERKELVRRVVHRRNAASAVRPWKGPIPKVCLPKPVLSDFITHNSWKIVRRKKARRSSAATVPAPAIDRCAQIRDHRIARLNGLLGPDKVPGLLVTAVFLEAGR